MVSCRSMYGLFSKYIENNSSRNWIVKFDAVSTSIKWKLVLGWKMTLVMLNGGYKLTTQEIEVNMFFVLSFHSITIQFQFSMLMKHSQFRVFI